MASGATVTTALFTCLTAGSSAFIQVADNTAFPPFSYLLATDGVSSTISGQVTATSGSSGIFFTVQSSTSGNILGIGSTVTFTGPIGLTGPAGPGATFTTAPFTCTAAVSALPATLNVVNNTAFPPNSYVLATDGNNATIMGQVLSQGATNQIVINVLQSTVGQLLETGSVVIQSGPPGPKSTTPGPQGPTGFGLPGHGSTILSQPLLIYPIGTLTSIYVQDTTAFPVFSYLLISDGNYAITAQVKSVNSSTNLGIRILNINSGTAGLSIQTGGIVSFSGPPGLPGKTNVGDLGTVFFQDLAINSPVMFNSGYIFGIPSTIGTMNFYLPNNLLINYRVVVDFTGNIVTNQTLTSTTGYIGIVSSAAQYATNSSSTFASIQESINPGPVINTSNLIADSSGIIGTVTNNSTNLTAKYIGTFNSGTQLDFTVVASATQLTTTFYVTGILTVTCYPIYQ